MCINWVAASAISTFILALVAIVTAFKDEILKRWRKPDLDASIVLEPPDCHSIKLIGINQRGESFSAPCFYFRLRVENKGKSRAESVEVVANRLCKITASKQNEEIRDFLPLNLVWSHTQSNDATDRVRIYLPAIHPGMYKHCDLAHIILPQKRKELGFHENKKASDFNENDTILSLDTYVKPNTNSHLILPGEYELEIVIASDNTGPKNRTLYINLTGKWDDAEKVMFRDHIGIRVL